MISINNENKSKLLIFAFCFIIFCVSAVLGWNKLHYGFNFIDEGYHATESWRLAAGDHFLEDKITGALMHYTLINRLIFGVCPDITLLGLRKIQFILTISTLLLFGLALYKVSGRYAELPFIFSVFAFTGLDPIGMVSNLYYQTYPHLFLTLHLSFLLLGLNAQSLLTKKLLLFLAGLSLWGMSLSSLYLSVIILSPFLLFFLSYKFNFKYYSFTVRDLTYVLVPLIFCWAVFIIIFNMPYVINIFSSIEVILSMPSHSTGLIYLNWQLIKYVSIAGVLLATFFLILQLRDLTLILTAGVALSVMIFFSIKTSLFGILAPYYNGLFGRPMWFSSVLIAFILFFWIVIFFKHFTKSNRDKKEELAIILLIPFTICALTMSIFSSLGSLAVCQTAIPATAGIFYFLVSRLRTLKYPPAMAIVMILLLLGPFYYMTAENDWEFTFFDVRPEQAKVTIDHGFGTGVKTNVAYYNLYQWIIKNAEEYSDKGDFIISYVVSPMVHMIAERRPSLDDTFITFAKPLEYYEKSIEFMKKRGRQPKMAFIFEGIPCLASLSLKKNTYQWFGKEFIFSSKSRDPISRYVLENMTHVDDFELSSNNEVLCFVDKKTLSDKQLDQQIAILKKSLGENLSDPIIHYKLGILFQRKGMQEKAIEYYMNALDLQPDFVNAMNHLVTIYSGKGDNSKSLKYLKNIIEYDPDNADAYYNIACVYSKMNQMRESLKWLKKAVEKGFNKMDLIANDSDLKNFRNTIYYREFLNTITMK